MNHQESSDGKLADPLRKEYRPLSQEEMAYVRDFKDLGSQFLEMITAVERIQGAKREFSLSKTKIEEAVMWVTKGLTG